MKRTTVFFVIFSLFCALGVLNAQGKTGKKAESKEKEQTIKGEVVDLACYMHKGAKGEDHKACAEACAKAGGQLAILTADGKLYLSLLPDDHSKSPNDILMDHVAAQVEATGMVREKGGMKGIMITKVEGPKAEKANE